jgi:predicted O-methyltransferase YrrM
VYSRYQLAWKYLHYYFTASNSRGHGVHSPFVFEFITHVLNDRQVYPAYARIEQLREKLLSDQRVLTIEDLGAGSTLTKDNRRTVASIARNAAKSRKFGQLLFRMARYYRPANILELGTSLGITTSYLASANETVSVVTMEGATEILAMAQQNFSQLDIHNAHCVPGNFDKTLEPTVEAIKGSIGLAFIDGNHRYQPTIQYFNSIITKTDNFSIVILDDIHWSAEMEQAWTYCRQHTAVTLSIDLFFIGILVFRKEIREKQHFRIRF